MASPPGIGPISGRQTLQNNMREARSHGYGRNAALPQTYLWFYQKVRINAAHWLLTVLLAIFAWLSYQPARPGHMALHHAEQRRRSHRSDRIPVLPTQRRWS
ncbi:UNVERIFIED_ORG: hypothetical protein J2806_003707 [Kosakonia oryzae]|uniref:Uncharacterized protein n=1 Tax=Kosakonia radicincitans TaxID=283686 RepID=A0AAX2EVB3_9ENTR|nr:hypothetical protein [Kosakonia oryzae]SFF07744.1 hypothetical protein SAMN03159468_03667 [Kosakonia radicincitans]SFR20809.1 hypothetical protein SAMN03159514_03425 [Kosakonia radicincitans]SFT89710.1 hypothetical protein SAMN03159428_02673 [Kosakonia radicincitans]SFX78842.1 hypothetical protein SAMN03159436_02669 [Kosakonia radicincitans]